MKVYSKFIINYIIWSILIIIYMSLIDANEKWARRSSEDPEITHETWDFPTTMRVLSTTEVLWPNDLSEGYACSGLANWALLTHFTSADWPWFYLQKTDGWPSKMTKRIHWYPKMFNPKRQGSALEGCLVKVILAQHPSNRTKQVIWLVDWCWLAPQNMVVIRDVFLPCGWKKKRCCLAPDSIPAKAEKKSHICHHLSHLWWLFSSLFPWKNPWFHHVSTPSEKNRLLNPRKALTRAFRRLEESGAPMTFYGLLGVPK